MSELSNEAKVTLGTNPVVVPDVASKPAQQWLGYMSPVVSRLTDAMLDTRSAIEKRLGFCPMAEAAKFASRGLDAFAEQLRRAASGLRAFADVRAKSHLEPTAVPPAPRAQA